MSRIVTRSVVLGTALLSICFVAVAQTQKSGPKPLIDWALIPGENGTVAGTISMIDGNQNAYFDAQGRFVSGTGRFEYKAKIPKGIYMDLRFEIDGQPAAGGFQVADMIIEFRIDGSGKDAKQFVFVDKLTTVDDSFRFAWRDKATQKIQESTARFTNLDYSTGIIYLAFPDLKGLDSGKKYRINLTLPLQGELREANAESGPKDTRSDKYLKQHGAKGGFSVRTRSSSGDSVKCNYGTNLPRCRADSRLRARTRTEHRRLKIARLDELNDPFELWAIAQPDPRLRRGFRNYKSEMAQSYGVVCFSLSWHNPLLWSHYAEKHHGIALGFDVSSDVLKKAAYVKRRPALKRNNIEVARSLLYTKYIDWKYEQEARVFTRLEERDERGLYFADFSDQIVLREVIVGPLSRVTQQDLHDAHGRKSGVKFTKGRLAFNSFRVVADQRGFRAIR